IVDYTGNEVTVSWNPSGGIIGFLLETPLVPEPPPGEDELDETSIPVEPSPALPVPGAIGAPPPPSGPIHYNLYRELGPDPRPPPAASAPPASEPAHWGPSIPAPVNPMPLEDTSFMDDVEFGRERCYTVRAVRGTPPSVVESEPSSRTCVTPED